MIDYEERERSLVEIGFKDYKQYLGSRLWKIIRREIRTRDWNQCRVRGCRERTRIQVHHLGYSVGALVGASPYLLLSLCRNHHERIERGSAGKKLDPREINRVTMRLVANIRYRKGTGEPRVGLWYKNQKQSNRGTKEALRAAIEKHMPSFYREHYLRCDPDRV